MKRSEINKDLKELEAMCAQYRFALPPFCHFTPVDWQTKGHEYDEVRECTVYCATSTRRQSEGQPCWAL